MFPLTMFVECLSFFVEGAYKLFQRPEKIVHRVLRVKIKMPQKVQEKELYIIAWTSLHWRGTHGFEDWKSSTKQLLYESDQINLKQIWQRKVARDMKWMVRTSWEMICILKLFVKSLISKKDVKPYRFHPSLKYIFIIKSSSCIRTYFERCMKILGFPIIFQLPRPHPIGWFMFPIGQLKHHLNVFNLSDVAPEVHCGGH